MQFVIKLHRSRLGRGWEFFRKFLNKSKSIILKPSQIGHYPVLLRMQEDEQQSFFLTVL